MHLLEIVAIRTIFNNYKNLGAIELQLQNKKFIIKMDELIEEFEYKLELKELISEEIESLKEEVQRLRETIETIDVELIRSKQEAKRIIKSIEKLKSLNFSRIQIDINEHDRVRIAERHSRLMMLKLFTRIIGSNAVEKFLLHDESIEGNQVKIIQLNKNFWKESNAEDLWESIGECSQYNAEWDAIFNN